MQEESTANADIHGELKLPGRKSEHGDNSTWQFAWMTETARPMETARPVDTEQPAETTRSMTETARPTGTAQPTKTMQSMTTNQSMAMVMKSEIKLKCPDLTTGKFHPTERCPHLMTTNQKYKRDVATDGDEDAAADDNEVTTDDKSKRRTHAREGVIRR